MGALPVGVGPLYSRASGGAIQDIIKVEPETQPCADRTAVYSFEVNPELDEAAARSRPVAGKEDECPQRR